MFKKLFLIAMVCLISCAAAAAEPLPCAEVIAALNPNDPVVLQLKNKELIVGTFVEKTPETVTVTSESLGQVVVPIAQIEKIEVKSDAIAFSSTVEQKPPPKIWSGKLEAGINGSEGNSSNLSARAAGLLERKTERNRLKFEGVYNLDYDKNETTQQREKTGHRATLDARSEWPFPSYPRLNYFLAGGAEYDEFKEFDVRLYGNTGLGMDFIKEEKLLFAGHLGAGASKEFGGPNDEVVPEGVAGLNFDWEPLPLQKLSASTEVFPDLKDLGEFRAVNKASYSFYFSKAKTFNVSLGAEHRYDSTPGMSKPNDLDYFATVGWLF